MAVVGEIKVSTKPVETIMKSHGLEAGGAVQRFHTLNVLRRITKYMPYRTGATIKLTQAQSPISGDAVNTYVPFARYLHEGKTMVNAATGKGPAFIPNVGYRFPKGSKLRATDRPLTYTDAKNPDAGPFWGRRLMAAEGDAMLQDLKNYVRRREGAR